VIRATGTLVRIRLDLGRSDTLASFPGNELYFANEAGGYGEVPFGRAGMVAAGRTVAVVAQNDSDWFAIHDLADGMVRRHKLGAAPHMVTRDEFARAVAAKIAEQPRPETRQLLAQVYRDVTVPKGRRFFRQLAVDALDHVWVESFEVWSGNRSLWFVFDRLGRRVGRVAMPQYARPLSITSDRIALHRREDSGAERIEVYSLTR
jgi:hypothetical protein